MNREVKCFPMGEERRELVLIRDILRNNPRGMSVTQIAEAIGMNRITVARYLDVMRASGLVEMEPYGQAKVFFISRRIPVTAILDSFSDGVAALDKNGRIVDVNRKFREIAGVETDDTTFAGRLAVDMLAFLNEDGRLHDAIERAGDGVEDVFEIQVPAPGTDRIFFRVRVVPTVFTDSSPGTMLIAEDVTVWRKEESRTAVQCGLAWSLSAAQTLFEAMPPCVDTAIDLSGMDAGGAYVPDPVTGVFELIHATGISPRFARSFSRILPSSGLGTRMGSGTPSYVENLRYGERRENGTGNLRSYAVIPVRDRREVLACFLVSSSTRDTIGPGSRAVLETIAALIGNTIQRIRAQERLRESEEKYRLLFNNLDDAAYLYLIEDGAPGRIIEVNAAVCKRLGYTREELLALTPLQICDPAYERGLPEILRRLLRERRAVFKWAHRTKDGTAIPAEVNSHLLVLGGREVVLSIARDLRPKTDAIPS